MIWLVPAAAFSGTIDSLKAVLKHQTDDAARFRTLLSLTRYYVGRFDLDSSQKYLTDLRTLSKKPGVDKDLLAAYYYCEAWRFSKKDDLDSSFLFARKSWQLYEELHLDKGILEANHLLVFYYIGHNIHDSALKYCNEGIELSRKTGNKKSMCDHYDFLAKAYSNMGKRELSLNAYKKALNIAEEQGYTSAKVQILINLSYFYNSIDASFSKKYLTEATETLKSKNEPGHERELYAAWGNFYSFTGQSDSALFYYGKSLALIDTVKDPLAYAAAIGNMGDAYTDLGEFAKSIEYGKRSLVLFRRLNDMLDVAIAYGSIGDNYLQLHDYKNAILNFTQANEIAMKIKSPEQLIENYKGIASCYEQLHDYANAFKNYKLYKEWNDTINNVDNAKKLTEQELKYQFLAAQKEQALLQKNKDALTQEQIKRQRFIIWTCVIGAVILLYFFVVTLRNSNIRKRINRELEKSHKAIEEQSTVIETKNREITDSITYAARLQQGILPDSDDVKKLLPGSFIFYRPRDIVSGDFYWVHSIKGSDAIGRNLTGFVVADCTGHGVPGAFMSFIGSTILNQTLGNEKVKTPADALNYLNEQLPLTLQSKTKTGQINDGMEAGICVLDLANKKLFFAGANLNLIHIRNHVVTEIKGDKHSIGINPELHKNFTDHSIQLEANDCVYLFSDGYADQFGGPKGKKFKYKNLLSLLSQNSSLTADEQLRRLSENFAEWKKDTGQLDDVLVFGIKI
ncbi:MAG: SpoIIE family protein phosphatase [Bacteroidia bacterium]